MPRNPTSIRTILATVCCVLMGMSGCNDRRDAPSIDRDSIPDTPKVNAADSVKPNPPGQVTEAKTPRNEPPTKDLRPQQVFRPDDRRPPHDDARLIEAGIRLFESERLKLYTDIDADVARTLPGLIDQAYVDWEEYLGPLPPDRAGTDFQMTGYLMRDRALFRDLGLVPEEFVIEHGRHLRNEFWMQDQAYAYYQRHLLIHEATHCFMTYMPDVRAPVWYLEGMAEYFAAHHLDSEKQAMFRVMPTSRGEFKGFDRITTIRDDFAANQFKTMTSIFAFKPVEFSTVPHYAWSWALCMFLDRTPRYHERFQKLSRSTVGGQLPQMFEELFKGDERDLATEWTLFAANLLYGYDLARAAIDFQSGVALVDEQSVPVNADRGWQSSGVRLEKDKVYKIAASGRFALGNHPKPWVSEPRGITFRYFDGRPIGMLLGCLRTEEGPAGGEGEPMLQNFAIGRGLEFKAPVTGTLYLRLNDAWNSLQDNRGRVDATIRHAE